VATRPYVFVNMAMTADGKIDTVERQGARISGEADTARVDALRAGADAIMVGGHTLISEDPRLTGLVDRRVAHGLPAQPVKVGVVSYLSLQGPPSISGEGAFLRAGGGRVVVFTSDRTAPDVVAALERQGAEVLVMGAERVDLARALKTLADRGVERLMVEGGSTIVAALLDDGLVDELQLTIAPLVFGGATAPTAVGGPGRSRASALRLRLAESSTSPDGDVVLRYLVGAGAGA
jgi:2,5-diamino-6-(ribosylamino)-4(3H)-pyrimidinone 5'-phosphate reductase